MRDTRKTTTRIGLAGLAALTFLVLPPQTPRSPQASTAADRLPPADEGEAIFKARCSICHGTEGGGETATGKKLKIPDLRSAEVQARTDDELTAVVNDGNGAMPSFRKKMEPEKINLVVAHVRKLGKKTNDD